MGQIGRRTFLVSGAALLLAPRAARAQPADKMHRIGFVVSTSPGARRDAFLGGLRDLGYIEGRNIHIETRFAEGRPDRFPGLIQEVIRLRIDVLVVGSTIGARAARQATTTIPIVFAGSSDPVAAGLVATLARPGGNITGFSLAYGDGFAGKWLELLQQAVPDIAHVAALWSSSNAAAAGFVREIQAAARVLDVRLDMHHAATPPELDGALTAIGGSGARGLIVMPSPFAAGNAALGADPLAHLSFLIHAPERVLALRLALSRVVGPASVVLDAGCGSLGVLAIMAAKLGAARVVAVDLGRLDLARALARENGVADRVRFVRGNLHDLQLPRAAFDVIIGMVYHNDIGADLAQQRLILELVRRLGHEGTAVVPNKVRYSVAGYDLGASDRSDATRAAEWNSHIANAERRAGMTFTAVRRALERAGVPPLTPGGRAPLRRNVLRYFDRSRMTLLTRPRIFAEIDYRLRSRAIEYPATASLLVARPGRLEAVVWQQDLAFDDLLIRTTESLSPVDAPKSVARGDTAILSTGGEWRRSVPLAIRRGTRARASPTRGRR